MSDQKFCIQCGASVDADAIFCPQCGARQDGAPVPPPKVTAPPPQYAPYQQPPYQQPVYQQPYPPQYPPYAAPPKKRGGGGLIVFIIILILLAGAFYGISRYTQLLPESVQEALPEWLQSESFDADEGEYITDDEEEEDEDSNSKDDKDDSGSKGGLFGKTTEESTTAEILPETTTDNGSGDNNNGGFLGNSASKLKNDDIFGKWDGELTFTEIVMTDEEKAAMSEDELAQMDSMLNKPMPLVFQFYKDDAGVYTTIGVITSPDFGESDMDKMFYDIIDGKLVMSFADSSSEVMFEAALGESNGTYAMDGTFSIRAIDGGGQSIKGVWNTTQTSTQVTLPE